MAEIKTPIDETLERLKAVGEFYRSASAEDRAAIRDAIKAVFEFAGLNYKILPPATRYPPMFNINQFLGGSQPTKNPRLDEIHRQHDVNRTGIKNPGNLGPDTPQEFIQAILDRAVLPDTSHKADLVSWFTEVLEEKLPNAKAAALWQNPNWGVNR